MASRLVGQLVGQPVGLRYVIIFSNSGKLQTHAPIDVRKFSRGNIPEDFSQKEVSQNNSFPEGMIVRPRILVKIIIYVENDNKLKVLRFDDLPKIV